jgi:hypothetical protein
MTSRNQREGIPNHKLTARLYQATKKSQNTLTPCKWRRGKNPRLTRKLQKAMWLYFRDFARCRTSWLNPHA